MKYNEKPAWDFRADDTLLEEGEVRIYEGNEDEPIAVVRTYEEAITVINAVNRLRGRKLVSLEEFMAGRKAKMSDMERRVRERHKEILMAGDGEDGMEEDEAEKIA
jgi:hypothetical protein